MTPLRPHVTASIRTSLPATSIWSQYEKLSDWPKWDPSILSITSPVPPPLKIGQKLTLTTSSPSYTGSLPLLSCFSPTTLTYTLPLPGCQITRSFEIKTSDEGVEVIHGIRYDGMMKFMYKEKEEEEMKNLKGQVEKLVELAEKAENSNKK
ncbi:hypothetical protein TrVE_jg14358 [Triparma verrucosa]|uniref:Uncharacterized protein n=1 Tax=Triparma verrucosa TaxID=1606542 RepID=A0A9W7CDL3_9STRA|nr:hypothetical protein TrVE_jg14358 [Triparma verrucosa]